MICAQPEITSLVLQDANYQVVCQPVFLSVTRKSLRLSIKFIESTSGSNPESSPSIFKNNSDKIVAQTAAVFGISLKVRKFLVFAVKFIEPITKGTNPEKALLVFIN